MPKEEQEDERVATPTNPKPTCREADNSAESREADRERSRQQMGSRLASLRKWKDDERTQLKLQRVAHHIEQEVERLLAIASPRRSRTRRDGTGRDGTGRDGMASSGILCQFKEHR